MVLLPFVLGMSLSVSCCLRSRVQAIAASVKSHGPSKLHHGPVPELTEEVFSQIDIWFGMDFLLTQNTLVRSWKCVQEHCLVHMTFDPLKAEQRARLNSHVLAFLPLRLRRVLGADKPSVTLGAFPAPRRGLAGSGPGNDPE